MLQEAAGPQREQGVLEQTPEAIEVWATALAARFEGGPIALCLRTMQICRSRRSGMLGKKAEAAEYLRTAGEFAKRWIKMADDGDHYRLAFDKTGTWSMKYNLVWDKLLGLNLFPPEVARKDLQFYTAKQNKYGLPLDNREQYTKLDWLVWTASLANTDAEFQTLITPAYRFVNESPSRVPLTDWYWTQDAKQRGLGGYSSRC